MVVTMKLFDLAHSVATKPGDALNQLEMLKKATGEDDDDEEDSASAVATPKTAGTSSVATPATAKPTIVVSPPSASAASVAQATVAAAAAASTAAAVASAVLPVANTAGTLPLLGQITAAPAGGYAAPAGMSFEDHLLHLYVSVFVCFALQCLFSDGRVLWYPGHRKPQHDSQNCPFLLCDCQELNTVQYLLTVPASIAYEMFTAHPFCIMPGRQSVHNRIFTHAPRPHLWVGTVIV